MQTTCLPLKLKAEKGRQMEIIFEHFPSDLSKLMMSMSYFNWKEHFFILIMVYAKWCYPLLITVVKRKIYYITFSSVYILVKSQNFVVALCWRVLTKYIPREFAFAWIYKWNWLSESSLAVRPLVRFMWKANGG